MHIAVNLGVQKIASFQVDNFLSEEVDHELNTAMDRFIKQRYHPLSNRFRKGFEHSQKRIDDLRNLVVSTNASTFFNEVEFEDTDLFFSDRAAFPNDYLFLVSLRAFVKDACKPVTPTTTCVEYPFKRISLTPPVTGYILKDVRTVLTVGTEDDPQSIIATPDDGNTVGLTIDQLLDPTNYTSVSLIPVLSVEAVSTGIVETYPTVDSNELYLKFTGEYGGSLVTTLTWAHPIDGTIVDVVMEDAPHNIEVCTRNITNGVEKLVSCDYSQLDDIYTMLDDPFNTTKSTSPLFTIQENFVDVYTNNEFVVNQVKLKYIRRPQRLSKSLGVGCELPEHTHQEIVEMAIKSILEGIQDPRYQSQTAEVAESE
jgi:hypothetical protein